MFYDKSPKAKEAKKLVQISRGVSNWDSNL